VQNVIAGLFARRIRAGCRIRTGERGAWSGGLAMNLWFRLLWVLCSALVRRRVAFDDGTVLRLGTWPGDIDLNLHVNNGRFLTLADLGRIDHFVRCGLLRVALRRGWRPVVGGALVLFRRPVGPFRRVRLHTRIVGWDERWTYVEHRFESAAGVNALIRLRALLVGKAGSVPPHVALLALGHAAPSPPLPDWAREWPIGPEAADRPDAG
jgi:acyl-CoA thioesterase FadM